MGWAQVEGFRLVHRCSECRPLRAWHARCQPHGPAHPPGLGEPCTQCAPRHGRPGPRSASQEAATSSACLGRALAGAFSVEETQARHMWSSKGKRSTTPPAKPGALCPPLPGGGPGGASAVLEASAWPHPVCVHVLSWQPQAIQSPQGLVQPHSDHPPHSGHLPSRRGRGKPPLQQEEQDPPGAPARSRAVCVRLNLWEHSRAVNVDPVEPSRAL